MGACWHEEKYGDHKIHKNGENITIDEWYADMQAKIANPDKLRQDVEDQIVHHNRPKSLATTLLLICKILLFFDIVNTHLKFHF